MQAHDRGHGGGDSLKTYLSGISVRKIVDVTEALRRVKVGKEAVSRIARRLEEQQREWRERSVEDKGYSISTWMPPT